MTIDMFEINIYAWPSEPKVEVMSSTSHSVAMPNSTPSGLSDDVLASRGASAFTQIGEVPLCNCLVKVVPRYSSKRFDTHSFRRGAPPCAAGIVWYDTPLLVPPHIPGVSLKLSASAFRSAKTHGIRMQGDTTPRPFPAVSFVSSCPTSSHSSLPSSPAWSKPRAWSQTVGTPVRATGRSALASQHNGLSSSPVSVTVSSNHSSPTRPSKPGSFRSWNTRTPSITIDELYKTAHTLFDAPLTIPVGLINQGNSCFASVILQMLIYCRPLYHFLNQLRSLVPQDLSNSTPLLEAVFRFYNEIPLADRTSMVGQHDMAPLLPDYIYEAMRLHKRFDLFQLGHQEDAEEFFSLILSTLHDEVQLIQRRTAQRQNKGQLPSNPILKTSADPFAADPAPASVESSDEEVETFEIQRPASPDQDEWLEVGQKGKTSLTRSSGTLDTESPITRIFDGKLRSTLMTPGSKTSVVLKPFRSLPLDIQPSHVRNINDALRQITVPETISGVWSQQRHTFVDATKQICLEVLPPVLVLHLKRFVFDGVYGVQKSTKAIEYGLTLDITPDILSTVCRRVSGTHKYALFGVVYHHGRLASGGHYTVAVKRQDDEGWIHIDDTHTCPMPIEDVIQYGTNSSDQGHAYLLFYQKM